MKEFVFNELSCCALKEVRNPYFLNVFQGVFVLLSLMFNDGLSEVGSFLINGYEFTQKG